MRKHVKEKGKYKLHTGRENVCNTTDKNTTCQKVWDAEEINQQPNFIP